MWRRKGNSSQYTKKEIFTKFSYEKRHRPCRLHKNRSCCCRAAEVVAAAAAAETEVDVTASTQV
ncbi:hypothetical protein E2C01_049618 [Portunus trituberculatus]|uniref:Uncharacterized protein n=1 Tax=Portunus trituberculatus TaxID=210409 RepID=A0A5B7GE64_PORTR|nr:hypothetical protein [Portunus trituberculatus]